VDPRSRVRAAARWVAGGFIVGLLLTRNLWLTDRLYPLTPVWSGLPAIPYPFDFVIYLALIATSAVSIVVANPRPWLAAGAALYLGYSLFDQQRWVPFFNEIGALLIVLALYDWRAGRRDRARVVLDTCGTVVVLIYLWSGLQKLNYNFVHSVGPWMLRPFLPESLASYAPWLSMPMAPLETALCFLLLARPTRRIGIALAIGMHAFILASAGPLGNDGNVQVWFWNIVSAALVWLVFRGNEGGPRAFLAAPAFPAQRLVVFFFGVMPIFNVLVIEPLGRWDDFQSATLYSGNASDGVLEISNADYERLPPVVAAAVWEMEDGSNMLKLRDWAYGELNVPDYHAFRIHRNAAAVVCRMLDDSPTVRFKASGKSHALTGERVWSEYSCRDLAGPGPLEGAQ
jgi:hypothetical protein